VQRVLDYHNSSHGTHIIIKGRAEEIYPDLKGQLNWDWVCFDEEAGKEIAVEVKRVTDEYLEERQDIIWRVLEEVCHELSGKVSGTFVLSVMIPVKYMPFKRQQKNLFKNTLVTLILKVKSHKIREGQSINLLPGISKKISFKLPDSSAIHLTKLSAQNSVVYKGSGCLRWRSPQPTTEELKKLEGLVGHANYRQLSQACNATERFLVIINQGFGINSHMVAKAFGSITPNCYSNIDRVYYVSGESVSEIPLPVIE
jgi:hypothetical protein